MAAYVQSKSDLEHKLSSKKTFASTGMRVIFKDLSHTVVNSANKKETLYLLKDVSGYFEAHEMSALMGPSGSGKTTLLDVLAGRKNAGKTTGTISFSGQRPTEQFLRRYTGYVEQFDTLIGSLTVYEMLMYTAELKRPMSEPIEKKREAVDTLLERMGLSVCRDVKIGGAMEKGISGGQAKRTNIGLALVSNPRLLFLDEPTSGLDSYTANEVMTAVKHLAAEGVTICSTIHSPTAYCFGLFDRLAMLVKGSIVYFGKPDHGAIVFAQEACPNVKEYLPGYNDAEYLVDLVTEADRIGRAQDLADHYAKSEIKAITDADIDEFLHEDVPIPEHIRQELQTKSSTVTPWWFALKTMFKYRTSRNYQDGTFMGPRIGDKIMVSLLLMTLFLNVGRHFHPDNFMNISAILFMWVVMPAFGAAAYVPSLVLERNLFTRERHDGLYLSFTYLVFKLSEELLLACLASLPVNAWVYYGIGIRGSWGIFFVVYYLTLCCGIVLAYFFASISPNLNVANALLPTYVVTLLFFAGFLMQTTVMPPWWKWYSYLDFLKYAWGALMVNNFKGDDPEWLPVYDKNGNIVHMMTVLENYGLRNASRADFVGYMALFIFVYFMATWAVIQFKKYQSR
uniref:ABC transporter domain-containing protein n=1 Tax=Polytomella parva TaxID=51329 RepID=A0A7S0ULM3_9CHLO|mmetsp:Transcript_13964/g.24467  ORF Transcript_13964/g.24467 Transcript_13964/m.24467 type:complete len:623 (+) Transcript_13964:99-1967(+)|eukprot:CAMPEP_0175079166 /NCGR_PEP_ID=MMETSP0052_2-20121109/24654_1 /TAXON_ID=51329 ORGANISM="Polytomella parva, Strain SAG 63-3" /NCGR_SAMPLE_ID=MMETSP0052_2 /ASSEMBLY_ACC=CAM_ASM_000194 /LENGTH=622 /DNA_ID=CAMNT_0016349431 /DNA_START=26 /DNA_END=1894 /DNA_ORIENTATION=-